MATRYMAVLTILFMWIGSSFAQVGDAALQVREDDGGSVLVHAANGILNQGSSLKRRWLSIDDSSSPARLTRAGLFTRFDEKEQTHLLIPVGTVSPTQAISAVEVRYVLFDVWGQRLRTITLTRLVDTSTAVDLKEGAGWPAWESEVSQFVTVVAFVARARTAEGQVWTYDPDKLIAQINALGLNATADDLIPDELRPIDSREIYWMHHPVRKGLDARP